MTDHTNLIARLRLVANISDEVKLNRGYTAVTDEAADALEALQGEVEAQKQFRDDIREAHESMIVRIGEMCGTDLSSEPRAKWALIEVSSLIAERDQLRAEVAKLKEASDFDNKEYKRLRDELQARLNSITGVSDA